MAYRSQIPKYIDLKTNGRLFPSWVLANFKKYKLPEIIKKAGEDPCNVQDAKLELKKYQEFLTKYMDYKGNQRDILIYHGLGAGKSRSTINIYNMLYNYTPGWNVFILLKATLKDHPWMTELEAWLSSDEKDFRFKNIVFISYDSPTADKQFLDAIKNVDSSKKSLYIIEECHNFIRNVYSNINSRQGKRAQVIYDYILQDKKENEGVRVIALSGTPAINKPYELALLFNLLRPGAFPKSETQFNQLYITASGYRTINSAQKNLFQRRILGLVSYYIGSTPDNFASKTIHYIDVEMSDYQKDIYNYFREIEDQAERKRRQKQSSQSSYNTYTRQACDFVFPAISQQVTGENRPRPNKFRLTEKEAENIEEAKDAGKIRFEKGTEKYLNVQKYLKAMETYINSFDDYLRERQQQDDKSGHTIIKDFETFHNKYNNDFNEFNRKESVKSKLYMGMYDCSAKMVNIIFNIFRSKGPVLVYSNYVLMEGLEVFKIYLKYFGFSKYVNDTDGEDDFRYVEYHGGVDADERRTNIDAINRLENKTGKLIKIMLISPAGSEGISLKNIRQVHIMEPYWHEVRITQMIGRAVRLCSHKDLPMADRHVDVFRYKSVLKDDAKMTTDQEIEALARSKETLIQSFLDAVKEVAVDCKLNMNHNMISEEYKCFQFDEPSLFDDQIGPAYKEDMFDDMKIGNGTNNPNSTIVRIKVKKIKAVKQLTPEDEQGNAKYSDVNTYWFNPDTGVVYDLDLHYAVGKVGFDDDNLLLKMDKDVYIINKLVPIPLIDGQ